jgi:flagellar biosynthesis component FlhA
VVVDVLLALGEHEAVVPSLGQQLSASLEERLDDLLNVLGIAGPPGAAVQVSKGPVAEDGGMVQVRVNGRDVHVHHELERSLAEYVVGRAGTTSAADRGLRDWIGALLTAAPHAALDYLTLVIVEAVKSHSDLLLTDGAIARYRATCADVNVSAAAVGRLLRMALRMNMSVANVEAITTVLREDSAAPEVKIEERVISALRADRIELRFPLEYLRMLTPHGSARLSAEIAELRTTLELELGVRLPPFEVVLDAQLLPESFCFRVNSLTTPPMRGLATGQLLVNETVDALRDFQVHAISVAGPRLPLRRSVVDAEHRELLEQKGFTTWDARGFVVLCLAECMRASYWLVVDESVIERFLNALQSEFPKLSAIVRALLSKAEITAVLRQLTVDHVPIRNVRKVGELLAESERFATLDERLAHVRRGMGREITGKYARSATVLVGYLLDPSLIELLQTALDSELTDDQAAQIVGAVRAELSHLPAYVTPPVLLVNGDKSSAAARQLLRRAMPQIHVMSMDEVSSDVNIQPVARIGMADAARA